MVTRRRGEELEAAIMDAAWAELESGWQRFSVEGVAERAGTGKAAIYRRWSNRVELARAAVVRQAALAGQTWAPTGQLREDLLAFGVVIAEAYDGPLGQAVRGIVAATGPAASFDPGVALPGGQVIETILAAAGLRAVGAPDRVSLALNLGISLISHQALVTGRAPAPDLLAAIVDDLWLPALEAVTRSR